jgi:hypothetical protein
MFVSYVQDEYVEGHRLTAWPMPLVAVGKVEHRGSKKPAGTMSSVKEPGKLRRVGSDKNGLWEVLKS